MNSQKNLQNSGWGNVTWNFSKKSTAHAEILQQSDSTSIIFTNYALENNVYGCKLTKFILVVIYYVNVCFGLFRG